MNSRHLVALYPLLCLLAWPAAILVAQVFRVLPVPSSWVVATAVVAMSLPGAIRSVQHDLSSTRLDSRTKAYRWILEELPADARILLHDEGPILLPGGNSLRRRKARLHELTQEGPFTRVQAKLIDILTRFPASEGRNIDLLGDPWWLSHEIPEKELRTSTKHLDMGNPLVSRIPKSLSALHSEGYRYLVIPGEQSSWQRLRQSRFPSWKRFYREIGELKPLKRFDPRDWNGQGPIVQIYEVSPPVQ